MLGIVFAAAAAHSGIATGIAYGLNSPSPWIAGLSSMFGGVAGGLVLGAIANKWVAPDGHQSSASGAVSMIGTGIGYIAGTVAGFMLGK